MSLRISLVLVCLFLVATCIIAGNDQKVLKSSKMDSLFNRIKGSTNKTTSQSKQPHYHPVLKNHAGIEYHAGTVEKLDRSNLLHRVVSSTDLTYFIRSNDLLKCYN